MELPAVLRLVTGDIIDLLALPTAAPAAIPLVDVGEGAPVIINDVVGNYSQYKCMCAVMSYLLR